MAEVNLVEKKTRMNHADIIKFQLMTYCFIYNKKLSEAELNCLALLGSYGEYELGDFCLLSEVSNEDVRNKLGKSYDKSINGQGIFSSAQTVRNFLSKAEKLGLINKKGKNTKTISLNPNLKIQTKGNILLQYKIAYVTKKE
tara:strand:- start:1132 stop:1557 length:426 start_codon:yes stop_codon:yes gene_type:complete